MRAASSQQPCQDEDFNEHQCTAAEVAEQKRNWEEDEQQKLQQDRAECQAMRAMMGGIDPTDPKAAKNWPSGCGGRPAGSASSYLGDGLFEVDFAVDRQARRTTSSFPTSSGSR